MTRQQVECNSYQSLQGIPQALWETSGPIEKRDGQLKPLAGRVWLLQPFKLHGIQLYPIICFLSF